MKTTLLFHQGEGNVSLLSSEESPAVAEPRGGTVCFYTSAEQSGDFVDLDLGKRPGAVYKITALWSATLLSSERREYLNSFKYS